MRENLKYWLAINKVPKMGPVTIKRLWDHFGSMEKIWGEGENNLLKIEGISRVVVRAFLEARDKIDLEDELDKIVRSKVNVLTLEDEDYPASLKNIYDPPPVLYVKGKILKSDHKALAIVGTRRASIYGKEIARKLALELSASGITIVSGMALGIDTAAHGGAIEAKGRTLAVFGCGVDVIYPPQNRDLAKQIEYSGALISEFPLGMGIEKGHFPRRNRVVSGLSLGVIVVEGHYDSGAMITAKYGLDQGREVFAVPGNVGLNQSKGPHWLIKQGAKLVESVEDILEELQISAVAKDKYPMSKEGRDYSNLSSEEQIILGALSLELKHVDMILKDTGFSISQVTSLLMLLEIKKLVRQHTGHNYSLA